MGCQSPQDTQQEEYYYALEEGMLAGLTNPPPPGGGSILLSFSIVRRYPFMNLGRARQYGVKFLVQTIVNKRIWL